MPTAVLPTLLRLPKKKRMQIAESLWLSVADDSMDVPPVHQKVITERLSGYRSGKARTVSHTELMAKLQNRE